VNALPPSYIGQSSPVKKILQHYTKQRSSNLHVAATTSLNWLVGSSSSELVTCFDPKNPFPLSEMMTRHTQWILEMFPWHKRWSYLIWCLRSWRKNCFESPLSFVRSMLSLHMQVLHNYFGAGNYLTDFKKLVWHILTLIHTTISKYNKFKAFNIILKDPFLCSVNVMKLLGL
jgi:hypothetical protein